MIGVTTAAGASWPACSGSLFGSFLNVVAYRLPRGESLSRARLALPGLRHPDQAVRQHPGALVAAAARALPRLRQADLRALSARRGSATALLLALTVRDPSARPGRLARPRVRAAARADHGDRPRPPDHPEQAHDRSARCSRSRSSLLTRPDDIPEHLIAAVAAGGSCSPPRSPTRPAWAWATSSSRSSWACSSAATWRPRCSSRSSPASLVGVAIMARKGVAEGRKTAIPFGPFLAFGGIVGAARRRRRSSTGTSTPSPSAPGWGPDRLKWLQPDADRAQRDAACPSRPRPHTHDDMKAVNLLPSDLRGALKARGRRRAPGAPRGRRRRVRRARRARPRRRCARRLRARRPTRSSRSRPSSREVTAAGAEPQRAGAPLKPYADFDAMAKARVATVRASPAPASTGSRRCATSSRALPADVTLRAARRRLGLPVDRRRRRRSAARRDLRRRRSARRLHARASPPSPA